MPLPTTKTKPSLNPDRAKVLIFGEPKVGKSTLAAELNPEKTLFISTEPGLDHLEVFKADVRSWDEFLKLGAEILAGKHEFTTFAIDTVDALHKMCSDYVCDQLNIKHPSDLEYGKGWGAVSDEFEARVAKLTALGGVIFISHAKDIEIKKRVGTHTKIVPDLSGKSRSWLVGFVDYIFYAMIEPAEGDEPERRVIRTIATAEEYEAGSRTGKAAPLPDPLPLDGKAVREAMEEATRQLQGESPKPAAKTPAKKPAPKAETREKAVA